jgi:hypothetical protein
VVEEVLAEEFYDVSVFNQYIGVVGDFIISGQDIEWCVGDYASILGPVGPVRTVFVEHGGNLISRNWEIIFFDNL